MTQSQEQGSGTLAQQMFGPQAGVYAQSKVHISDDSLESVQKLTAPALRQAQGDVEGSAAYRWAVDIGTGGGIHRFRHGGGVGARGRQRHHAAHAAADEAHQRRAGAGQRAAGPERGGVAALRGTAAWT